MDNIKNNQTKELNCINKVICVCAQADIEVWSIANKYILLNISANSYLLIVPDNEVKLFEKFTDKRFAIHKENFYVSRYKENLFNRIKSIKKERYGWYLQQIIKLSALSKMADGETYLIWDADTIPLKKINFYINNKVGHYFSNEFNNSYFLLNKKILGIEKKINYSFISQCLLVKQKWIFHLIKHIEKNESINWLDCIINNIDYNSNSGLSEYELIGSFISEYYPNEIYKINNSWLRNGKFFIGNIKLLDNFLVKMLLYKYDYIAFEKWDLKINKLIRLISFLKADSSSRRNFD
jgi:hypothetical protein